ncbi:MAG: TonB-dependent siderophore receptor [Panacagrimonas sp.]
MWKKTLLAAAVAGFTLSAGAADPEPQDAPKSEPAAPPKDDAPVKVDTITVTGERIDEGFKAEEQFSGKLPLTIRETPQSVSVITREALDARQVMNLGQALELSAGVTQYSGNGPFAGQPSFGFNQTTIRGIDIDSIFDFREDGFVSGSFYSVPDLAIYDRIEVVKGPNSVLYGRGSPGGLINRIRKKPLPEANTDVELSVGSFDTYRGELDATGPLFSSKAARGRLVAVYEDSGSFVRGPETQRTVLAPSLDLDLTASTRLLLQTLYQSEDIVANTGVPLRRKGTGFEPLNVSRRQYNGVVTKDPYTWEIFSATAQLDQQLGDKWLATLRLSSSNIDTPIRTDAYAYGLPAIGDDPSTPDVVERRGDTAVLGNDFAIDRDIWSGELQLSGRFDLFGREAKAAFGVDHNENQYSRRGAYTEYLAANIYDRDFPLPDRETLTPGFATEGAPVSRGAFAQAQVRPTERLAVLLGVRYDKADLRTTPFHPVAEATPRQEKEVDDVTGRIGLTYDLTKQVSVYTLYAQSFQPVFTSGLSGELLDPETGEIYELGAKTEWFDGKLGVNAAVYRVDRDKIPTSVEDDPNDEIEPFSISSGLQRSDGFEVEVNGRPLPGWDVSLAFNQLDSAYENDLDPLFGTNPGGTADWQFAMFSVYELQTGALKGLGFGASVFAIDDRGIGFQRGTIPGYERVDLHASYKGFKHVEINLVVRNLTDETYIEGADRPGAYAQFGSPTAALLSVKYSL